MKHDRAIARGGFHAPNCHCPRCRHVRRQIHGAETRDRITAALAIAAGIVVFALIPGRALITWGGRAIAHLLGI